MIPIRNALWSTTRVYPIAHGDLLQYEKAEEEREIGETLMVRVQDLYVFMSLAHTRSLHRAAQKCGLTQSAITKIVQRLETEFGVPLVDRSGRGIELTVAGAALVQRAASVQQMISDTYSEMNSIRSTAKGKIRFGSVTAVLEPVVLPLMAKYVSQEKGVTFELRTQVSSVLLDDLSDGQLDLVLCFSGQDTPKNLLADDLIPQKYYLVGREGHPLLEAGGDIAALSNAKWLLPPPQNGMRELVERYLIEHGARAPQGIVETDVSTALLTGLIRRTDLITMLTEQMLASHLGAGLVPLPYPGAVLENRLKLFYRRNVYMPPLVNKFRSDIHEKLGLLPSP